MAEPDTEEKQFSKGVEVLARWKDGIWYLANVQEVQEKGKRCQVVFEDGTVTWLFYKDLQSSLTQLDLQCMVCHDGTSKKPNEIVLCDQCEQGYHQKCHIPEITTDMLQTTAEWFCRQCVFGNSAKAGGAAKQGPDAEALRSLKRSLPYDLKSLHWDTKHKSNKEDLYCYCGGPGDWSCKMLQCNKCEQWFHEACIQCLNHPLLAGDRFYVFVCGVCNEGKEYIKRMKLRWVEVAHFALYYLSTTYKKKFHTADDIIDFIDDHWDSFQLGESTRASRREAHEAIREVLGSTPSRFKQSSHDTVLYALKSRSPPQPPKLTEPLPPPGTELEDEVGTSGVQQRKRGKKRRLASPEGGSSDEQSEVKSRRMVKAHELRSKMVENPAADKTPRGKQRGSKSKAESLQGEDVPMFPSPSMFKYLYSSSSKSPESDKSPSTEESSSSVTCTSAPSTGTVSDQQPPKINFVPDPVRKDSSKEKTVLQTDVTIAPTNSDSSLQPQPSQTDKEDAAENQGRNSNIVEKENDEKERETNELGNKGQILNESTDSDEMEDVDAPPGSHIVTHVMSFEDPMAVETETASDVKADSQQEEQFTPEVISTDGLQTEDVEDYVVISRASDTKESVETGGNDETVVQISGDTERSNTAECSSEKTELENRVEEEQTSGQDSEFVLMMEESFMAEEDSFKEAEEEPDTNVSTNGHVVENITPLVESITPLDKDTNGVVEEQQNGVSVAGKSSDFVTEEKSSTDVELLGEDGGMQITCHTTEEMCHVKTRDDDVLEVTAPQIIHDSLEEGKSCTVSAAVGSFESKPFSIDTGHELFPVEYQMEEK